MDLYEALKTGTEPDELERKFKEELAAAVKKFNDEEDLNDIREELAAEIIDYLALVLGEGFVKYFSVKDIVETLKSM
jgi:NTP pyrophosphatase (non-canonical NTP hydrolase)